MNTLYDVIIIGAGPAGLTAGICCGRYRLKTLVLEKGINGGQIALTSEIENYPGLYDDSAESGVTLTSRMRDQAVKFGAEFASCEIVKAELKSGLKRLISDKGDVFEAKAVIIAAGANFRHIGCQNEDKLIGSGISYCATCDANFFAGLDVYVVGGGESALEESMYIANVARRVTIIHRRDSFRASDYTVERVKAVPNISFMMDTVVEEAIGDDVLEAIRIKNVRTGEENVIRANDEDGMIGLFAFVGMNPQSDIFAEAGVELENGYIKAGEDTNTNIEGVFAAGDIRTKRLRQVVTACADGAVAASEAERYINS